MKAVIWTDNNGRKRRSLIKDGDTPEMAKYGIPADPPDVRTLDIEAILQEIETLQYQQGLFTWRAALDNPGGMQALLSVFKRHLLGLYRNK